MARGLHHVEGESRPGPPLPSDAPAHIGQSPAERPRLRDALARTAEGPPADESTFLSRRARLLAIGVALEQRLGAAGYNATLGACEAMLAHAARPRPKAPAPANQLALAFADPPTATGATASTASAETARAAPYRTRPARRRWR